VALLFFFYYQFTIYAYVKPLWR